jgi:hypothetical protein
MVFYSRLLGAMCPFIAFISLSANAVTVIPSDYMIAGQIGDIWEYQKLDDGLFTWTLSEVASGPYAGLKERGRDVSGTDFDYTAGMIYDLTDSVLTIHEWNNIPADPSSELVFSEIELGQVVTLNDDPVDPSMYLFWDVPSVSVQAGTYNDVVALVWLDGKFGPNVANTSLGLDSSITTAAVTDIDYFARGTGQVAYVGIAASTGLPDGIGFELVSSTVVPLPAALWLFGSGLLGLIGVARITKS